MMRITGLVVPLLGLMALVANARPPEVAALVPQRLVQRVHAREVQAELALSPEPLTALDARLTEVDAAWLPSRSPPLGARRGKVATLERRVWDSPGGHLAAPQMQRLLEIERQAQGVRMMFREDLGEALRLTPEQIAGFADRAREADAALERCNEGRRDGGLVRLWHARPADPQRQEGRPRRGSRGGAILAGRRPYARRPRHVGAGRRRSPRG